MHANIAMFAGSTEVWRCVAAPGRGGGPVSAREEKTLLSLRGGDAGRAGARPCPLLPGLGAPGEGLQGGPRGSH